MSLRSRFSRLLRSEEGKITWVTALLLIVVVGGGYLAVVWFPIGLDVYSVKQVVRDYGNKAVMNINDDDLKAGMLEKLKSVATTDGVDDSGRKVRIPVVDLQSQDVVWERDNDTHTLHVAFDYARPIKYPLLDKSEEKVFHVDMTMDISRPDWNSGIIKAQ